MPETQTTEIILQGGAMRGAFGAGVLYEFGKRNFFSDTIAAASASVPTAAYYASRQLEEMRTIWLEEVGTDEFLKLGNVFRGEPIYDIEYLITEIFQRKHPLSVEKLVQSDTKLLIPLYNYLDRQLEFKTNKDNDFAARVWELLHISMVVHDKHILWGNEFEKYVDGALDPFALYKLDHLAPDSRVLVIWNEPRFHMHLVKSIGQKLFLFLQAKNFPEEVIRMLKTRSQLIDEGMKRYERFCAERKPIVIKPDRLSLLDGFDVLAKNGKHLRKLFEHGREQASKIFSE